MGHDRIWLSAGNTRLRPEGQRCALMHLARALRSLGISPTDHTKSYESDGMLAEHTVAGSDQIWVMI